MSKEIHLTEIPPKLVLEAYLSGSEGEAGSYGGLDGKGPMVTLDADKGKMVLVSGFSDRIFAWRQAGGENPCPLRKKPSLAVLNAFLSGEPGYVYHRTLQKIGKFRPGI